MIRFSKEKALLLHQLMAEATGGSVGVRDDGLLESALESLSPIMRSWTATRESACISC